MPKSIERIGSNLIIVDNEIISYDNVIGQIKNNTIISNIPSEKKSNVSMKHLRAVSLLKSLSIQYPKK